MLHSQKHEEKLADVIKSEKKDSGYNTNAVRIIIIYLF